MTEAPPPRPAARGRAEEVRLRPMTDADTDVVLALNHTHVAVLSPLDAERLHDLRAWSQRADVVEVLGDHGWTVAGFVLVVGPGTAYDSPKYRWFAARYPDFLYLDRVVVDERHHRRGLGSRVYDAVEADAAAHGRLCLEVDVDPPNEPSLAFHAARGFTEVARWGDPGAVVSMQVSEVTEVTAVTAAPGVRTTPT